MAAFVCAESLGKSTRPEGSSIHLQVIYYYYKVINRREGHVY